ncbi:ABC transporter ATP-binding protein [Candidatus Saccharibacteria bacterium]|nr:ABC transporter ATP-binding protein [Candidatus Saccharibacteria bacterium]
MNIIETTDLTKYYGHSIGIKNVSLTIKQGEIFGFVGPNGAGKSTTIRALLGLISPSSGTAKIFGKDVTKDGPSINAAVGYLPSEVFYYDGMRAIDLLKYSGSFYPVDQKAIHTRIHELAELLNLDLTKKVDDLSYGNKKKVGIIQGLIHSPKLIILDEPTGGLDPLMQQTFFELLRKENERGATILFSSHILGEVQKLCHRVAVIKEGSIVAVESISDLIENNYKKVSLQFDKKFDIATVEKLEGVSNVTNEKQRATFLFKGRINDLTAHIAALDLVDATIVEPDLEEIFMHYYRKEA